MLVFYKLGPNFHIRTRSPKSSRRPYFLRNIFFSYWEVLRFNSVFKEAFAFKIYFLYDLDPEICLSVQTFHPNFRNENAMKFRQMNKKNTLTISWNVQKINIVVNVTKINKKHLICLHYKSTIS